MFVVSVKKSSIKAGVLTVLLVASAMFGMYVASKSVSASVESAKNGIDYKVEVREEMAHCNMNDFPDTRGRFIEFILKAFKCI